MLSKTKRYIQVVILENLNFKKGAQYWLENSENLPMTSTRCKFKLDLKQPVQQNVFIHTLFTSFFFMNIEMLFIFQILMFLKKKKPPQPIQPDFVILTKYKYTLFYFF